MYTRGAKELNVKGLYTRGTKELKFKGLYKGELRNNSVPDKNLRVVREGHVASDKVKITFSSFTVSFFHCSK